MAVLGKLEGMGRSLEDATGEDARRLEAEGQPEQALQVYLHLKVAREAARLAESLGRPVQAAELYAEAGLHDRADVCRTRAAQMGERLEQLLREHGTEDTYRARCVDAIRMAIGTGTLGFRFEHFVRRFVDEGPRGRPELDAFCQLGDLYEEHGLSADARRMVDTVLDRDPNHKGAASRLRRLGAGDADDPLATAGSTELPDLPDLPDLPALPDLAPPPLPGAMPGLQPAGAGAVGAAQTLVAGPPGSESVATAQTLVSPGPGGVGAVPGGNGTAMPVVSGIPAMPTGAPGATAGGVVASAPPPQHPTAGGGPADGQGGFAVGVDIAGRYRIVGELGRGAMAIVYHAHDLELGDEVALKVFQLAGDDELGRFREELRLSRRIQHENVIRLYDIGVQGGQRYISMELLEGCPLSDRLGKPLSLAEGIGYLAQACAGLQAAHDLGVVHRDVKPDNLFVTEGGLLKVMDFGIAKQEATGGTLAGTILGTPQYMSPEQISGSGDVTPAADLYALGVIAYEIFTGTLPFDHDEVLPLLMMHTMEDPEPPSARSPGMSGTLEAIILRLLAKDPAARPASCAELARELDVLRPRGEPREELPLAM